MGKSNERVEERTFADRSLETRPITEVRPSRDLLSTDYGGEGRKQREATRLDACRGSGLVWFPLFALFSWWSRECFIQSAVAGRMTG